MKKFLKEKSTIVLIMVSFCLVISAQNQTHSAQMEAADKLFKAQKWSEAATAYEMVLKDEPGNGNAWYQLATARYSLKQYPQAATAFEKNVAISNSGFAMYNLACVYSLMGEKEKAVEWLAKTVENPQMILQAINFNDSDLTGIKEDSRVTALAEKVGRKTNPCLYSDEAKQFNFFVGEWDAYSPQGQPAGGSNIQSIANGCGILENWHDSFGGEGKSINFFDLNTGKWYEYWIGRNGVPLRYSGVYKDGAIRYEGEPFTANGKTFLRRLTFFKIDNNTVRQLFENSSDDGKTWTPGGDLKYIRKSSKN